MIQVSIVCKTNKVNPEGLAPTYLRLIERDIYSKKRIAEKLISLKKPVQIKYYTEGRVTRGHTDYRNINAYFGRELGKIEAIIAELEKENKEATIEGLLNKLNNEQNPRDKSFTEYAADKLKLISRGMSIDTWKMYKLGIKGLNQYYPNVGFDKINKSFLEAYESHLRDTLKRKKSGYVHDFQTMRRFWLLAMDEGIVTTNPFRTFDFSVPEKEIEFLDVESKEYDKLFKVYHDPELPMRLKRTLHWFLIACHTGIRFGDTKRLSKSVTGFKVSENYYIKDGVLYFLPHKTKKRKETLLEIPLPKRILEIIESGIDRPLKESNSRVNADLEEIMELAGIKKKITFHCSRHSFAMTCLNEFNIDIQVIQLMLGHSTDFMTKRYARLKEKIKRERINKAMAKWND